ncbi:hypothetical protein PQR71_08920 [Paraburkholderia fungorum]|jgi:hypothetical protein|uniref:hypothetical protein n=1 Tax=Paraburkholderia fungorum TaxID=134537 RepID=UPI0038B91799
MGSSHHIVEAIELFQNLANSAGMKRSIHPVKSTKLQEHKAHVSVSCDGETGLVSADIADFFGGRSLGNERIALGVVSPVNGEMFRRNQSESGPDALDSH